MPPKATSIASYFIKSPPKPATTTTTLPTKQSPSAPTSAPSTSSPLSSPATNPPKSKLSDAARKAIADAIGGSEPSEPVAKRAKLSNGATNALALLSKPSQSKTIKLPPTTSRSELRQAINSADPSILPLLELELDTLGEDWLLALQNELVKPYFLSLKEFIVAEQKSKKVFPPAEDMYSWSRFCPLDKVRVVIIGQDPYHDDGQAHGLAFSVKKGVRIPPSLRNIYKQMSTDVEGFKPPLHGDLSEWAKHGVLLLNTSLTVRAHEAASHSKRGWEQFTAAVLKVVVSRLAPEGEGAGGNGVVFMAWGAHAAKMCVGVDEKKHLILRSAHPSPLSASRGFLGNGHFKKSNEWLENRYGPGGGIDWGSLSV